MSSPRKPSILFIPLEFRTWHAASHWSYQTGLGFEEGFTANGVDFLTLPSLFDQVSRSTDAPSWLAHAKQLIGNRRFDIVWFDIGHSQYDDNFLEWLSTLAPVRLGFLCESIATDPREYVTNSEGTKRRIENTLRNINWVTHLLAVDEVDVARINAEGKIRAMWLSNAKVPAQYIHQIPSAPRRPEAIFYGTMYGDRQKWLEDPRLKDILVRPQGSPETRTELPKLYDRLHESVNLQTLASASPDHLALNNYLEALRRIRRECYKLWLEGLAEGSAVVNLPQYGRMLPSRVIEGMAVGRPVISWEIEGRPRTKAIFEDGKEILFYSHSQPEQLAEHILRVQKDKDFARAIADAARKKLMAYHTTEGLIPQVLKFVETGEEPRYDEPAFLATLKQINPTDHRTSTSRLQEQAPVENTISLTNKDDFIASIKQRALWDGVSPLRLHLGCGETRLQGYLNIDYAPAQHNVMHVKPDIYADITSLNVAAQSIDEIRLHHVFEHFSRVTALAMLIKWHSWLKVGGKIHLETPDLEGSARNLVSESNWKVKMGTVRHLAGDQAAGWAYHVDHWFPERFQHTLSSFGFEQIQIRQTRWNHEPFLCNVEVQAIKSRDLSQEELLKIADALLWESTVAEAERPTYEVWCAQLRNVLNGGDKPQPVNTTTIIEDICALDAATSCSGVPLSKIHDFNQQGRDTWIAEKARSLPPGSTVLDVGAGTCPYRELFAHCDYKTHDFKQYEGEKLGGTKDYGHIDYVSDIVAIPVPDASFDAIICTEVFEHIPEPIKALKELSRILKPGGKLFLTAPLGSGLHQLPFHFYGGYTPQWYRHFCQQSGLEVVAITPNGGFFKHLAQECVRAGNNLEASREKLGESFLAMQRLLCSTLPRIFFDMDSVHFNEAFTVGYFLEARRPGEARREEDATLRALQRSMEMNPSNPEPFVLAALHLLDNKRFKEATSYVTTALKMVPGHPNLTRLHKELLALTQR